MKMYCRNIVIEYHKRDMNIVFQKEKQIDQHHDNMEYVLVDVDGKNISMKGNYITVLINKNCCPELNYNTNNTIPLSSVRNKYLTKKKKYMFFGKDIDVIEDGYFELIKSNNRTIKSNVFTIETLCNGVIISDETYEVLDKLITRYNETEFDNSEYYKWFEYSTEEFKAFKDYESILEDLIKNEIIEHTQINKEDYWRLK